MNTGAFGLDLWLPVLYCDTASFDECWCVISSVDVWLPVLMCDCQCWCLTSSADVWLPVFMCDFPCWCVIASVYVWLPMLMCDCQCWCVIAIVEVWLPVLMGDCQCDVWLPVLMCDCQCWCESLGVLMSFCLCFWRMIASSDVWLRCRCKIASADVRFLYLDVRLWVCVDVWFEYSLCVNYVCACCVRARCLTKRIPAAAASLTFQNIRVKASLPQPLLPFPCQNFGLFIATI
jgi:hypothetical protein